jgi:hypothetical protein
MIACDEVPMTYHGTKPKPTFIPAVGAQAAPAAQEAARLIEMQGGSNGSANGKPLNDASGSQAEPKSPDVN